MEQICKLEPHRTMHLQGFDGYGSAAALWGASASGFNVSGVWRDQADFAVVVFFVQDDPFGHPLFSYLPDDNFAGSTLNFTIEWQNVQAFESKKFPWTDWAYLSCLDGNGNEQQVKLSTLATAPGGRTGASGVFTLNSDATPQQYDRVTLWVHNLAFDYIVPAVNPSCVQAMWWQGNSGYVHSVTIGAATYSVAEGSLNSAQIASNIAGQINASDPNCSATVGGAYSNEITIALKGSVSGPVAVSSTDGSAAATLTQVTLAAVCANIAAQINAADWVANGPVVLSAAAAGNQITITAEPGADGNIVTFYQLNKNTNLYFTPNAVQLAGGSSDSVPWNVTVDCSALGWTNITKLWLTFAAPLMAENLLNPANVNAYPAKEFLVQVSNWSVTDVNGVSPLYVAGPGSVRIEETSPWVSRSGYWEAAPTDGFAYWSQGQAIRAAAARRSRSIAIPRPPRPRSCGGCSSPASRRGSIP